jgi:hypothetical protein
MQTNILGLSGIRTHDPSVRADENISCLRLRGHCDWRYAYKWSINPFTNPNPVYSHPHYVTISKHTRRYPVNMELDRASPANSCCEVAPMWQCTCSIMIQSGSKIRLDKIRPSRSPDVVLAADIQSKEELGPWEKT